MTDIPLSLYVHIPWCIKKCPYCDFNSHEIRSPIPEDQYINALIVDLQQQASAVDGREIISVFIGGGTPSLFSANSIQHLLLVIKDHLTLTNDVEISIEANPGTFDQQNFVGFRNAGINRISIGVQSFSDTKLQTLGRIHNAQTALAAVRAARHAGFENINIDLMYALPNQTLQEAAYDVEQAIALNPTHISYYQLTIEPNTSFYRCPPCLPNNEHSWDMQQQGVTLLAEHEYQQYEVSAFAQNKYLCVHNSNYWQFGDYVGIGAGAHQKVSCFESGTITRSEKPRHPQQFIRQACDDVAMGAAQLLTHEDLVFEFLLNALRLKHGFSRKQFESHTGLGYTKLLTQLETLENDGLIIIDKDRIRCSKRGYRFLDEVLQRLLPEKT